MPPEAAFSAQCCSNDAFWLGMEQHGFLAKRSKPDLGIVGSSSTMTQTIARVSTPALAEGLFALALHENCILLA
jgi:hypothetical protein